MYCSQGKVHLMNTNNQVLGLHTIIRDRTCSREDFIFYSNRLNRLLIEEALSLLPYNENCDNTYRL